jgi:hypothetical protein
MNFALTLCPRRLLFFNGFNARLKSSKPGSFAGALGSVP